VAKQLNSLSVKGCESIFGLNIVIQLQPVAFNIGACMGCRVIRFPHNQAGLEKRCNPKMQPHPDAELWRPVNGKPHTKNADKSNILVTEFWGVPPLP
jgi:hypothetical protein